MTVDSLSGKKKNVKKVSKFANKNTFYFYFFIYLCTVKTYFKRIRVWNTVKQSEFLITK